jgi:hypothetical protein
MTTSIVPFDAKLISALIERTAREQAELPVEVAREVAFHLTDWLTDLAVFVEICKSPTTSSKAKVHQALQALLTHAPNHLAAAAKLYVDFPVSDIFGVGAVEANTTDE